MLARTNFLGSDRVESGSEARATILIVNKQVVSAALWSLGKWRSIRNLADALRR
ncbi:hypothetical protein [Kamptonema sp. UHCC 0994]|uniref:hypothetical protein n=1 Tax=Kamptonema sp. UHCC 0994 TaxID=3031329 RepID=UPI0023B8A00C|nr:hypothetical protein [Kamptonema sp. UHCC 0994]MDF0555050.1 hypothetical protein [Kamptonema sp. UHCC 0994]